MALFRQTVDIKPFFPARLTLDIADILPTMERVENDYLVAQVLGQQQYDELHTAYQADALTSRLTDLLKACRPVVANLAVYHFADVGALQLTSTGFVVGTPGGQENIASENKVERFKREQLQAGYSFMDKLLGFLQARISDFPLWSGSPYVTTAHGLLRNTAQFNQALDIGNSHWLFWRMRHIMTRHQDEDSRIATMLCNPTLYNQLVSESNAGDAFTGQDGRLMAIIRPAIAHLTLADAVTELSLSKDQRGIWTFASLRESGPIGAENSRLDTWQKYHQNSAEEWLGALDRKLKALAAAGSLALYASSTCYTDYVANSAPPPRDPTKNVGNFM